MRNELETLRLPRRSLTRWLVNPGRDVPTNIRVALVDSLYGTLPIFFGGVFNTIAVSALIATRHPTTAFLIWAALELLLAVVRLPVLVAGRRAVAEGRRGPTDLYILLALLWAASVGYGTFISVVSGDWVAATLACLSAAAMVGGICFRNFAAPRLAAVMILASLGPCGVAAVLSGEPILLITVFQIPFYLFSMSVAARHLNKLLVRTMRAEIENAYRARHDLLTGLPNRAGLEQDVALRTDGDASGGLSLFYLDLDGFKAVNDTFGHAAGDDVLMAVADRLRALVGPGDAVARIGGDEFVVATSSTDRAVARALGDSLVEAIAQTPYILGDEAAFIGVSVGAAFLPEQGKTLADLLNAADAALYDAKSRGRSRCVIAGESIDAPASMLEESRDRLAQAFAGDRSAA